MVTGDCQYYDTVFIYDYELLMANGGFATKVAAVFYSSIPTVPECTTSPVPVHRPEATSHHRPF